MIKVNNQAAVQDVAKKTWRANRRRNLVTILAVVLTTLLIVSVLGIGISYWQMISERQIKMEGRDFDFRLSEPTAAQTETARNMAEVKYAGLLVKCATLDEANGTDLSKLNLYWADEICWEKQCLPAFESLTGSYPKGEDEILLSTGALRDMGIAEPQIGMNLSAMCAPLVTGAEPSAVTFTLSGWYKDYTGSSIGYVSEAMYRETGVQPDDLTKGQLLLTLKNPIYTEQTILSMQKAFDMGQYQYLSADPDTIRDFLQLTAILAVVLLMVFISGYLFIYNTLYISISRDISYYGQLKTLGMTSVQLKKVIYLQALGTGCIGIPLGLLVGWLVSIKLIPAALSVGNSYLAETAEFTWYPLLFFLASCFCAVVIVISSKKPADIAGNCSPIEAMRFTLPDKAYIKKKNSGRMSGGNEQGLKAFAVRNMFRDRKKTAIVLASFTISLILFLTVNVVILENDSRRILDHRSSCDMRILNLAFTYKEEEERITQEQVRQLKELDSVAGTGIIYSTAIEIPYQEDVFQQYYRELYDSRYAPSGDYEGDMERYRNGEEDDAWLSDSRLVGIDDWTLEKALKRAGLAIDLERFHRGELALTEGFLDVRPTDAVGKVVSYPAEGQVYEAEIAGVLTEGTSYYAGGYTPKIIVSEEWYQKIVAEPVIEQIQVDYRESLDEETERQVRAIFSQTENLSYDSKLDVYHDMLDNEMRIRVLGSGLGLIVAFLAVLNYGNMMAADIQNRRKEFAILESIGMTARQRRRVLIQEGLGYALISIGLCLLAGIPISYLVFQSLNTWGLPYVLPVGPNLLLFGCILLISAIIPPAASRLLDKGTVLERLRAGEE